jgi:A/G-specific adenine glycosylase
LPLAKALILIQIGLMHSNATQLLDWYDRHRRALPWRALPGVVADPYRVWLSEIMLQQTTVQAVKPYFERFLMQFPDVEALAAAPSEAVMTAWAGLGYYSRARNLHACAKLVVAEHGGRFPDSEAVLITLPGIGPYTAAAIAAIAFNRPAAAVDGNVERVLTRLHAIETELPAAKPQIKALTLALVPADRPGDFAQALMDLGATICTPKSPACALCPWSAPCVARQRNEQVLYPRKAPKITGKTRYGAAFIMLRSDGSILLQTRPPRGLLGGMAQVPVSAWSAGYDLKAALDDAPLAARWTRVMLPVRHVFTHFPLEMTVYVANVPAQTAPPTGMRFTKLADLQTEPLPTVMRKAIEIGLEALEIGASRPA